MTVTPQPGVDLVKWGCVVETYRHDIAWRMNCPAGTGAYQESRVLLRLTDPNGTGQPGFGGDDMDERVLPRCERIALRTVGFGILAMEFVNSHAAISDPIPL
jgi:hypothetical protein